MWRLLPLILSLSITGRQGEERNLGVSNSTKYDQHLEGIPHALSLFFPFF